MTRPDLVTKAAALCHSIAATMRMSMTISAWRPAGLT